MPIAAATRTIPGQTGRDARRLVRSGQIPGSTAALAPGYVQGNLAVLPQALAPDFERFCRLNPKPCPIIGISKPGAATIPELGIDLDLRTDIPGYRIWENGEPIADVQDAAPYWRDDLVSFVIGCSYSFEEALTDEGIELRHVSCDVKVPMYRTNIATKASGRFHGPMVVSMRPMSPANAIRAVEITGRYPAVHGAPVHIGLPHLIGIADIAKPDYGDAVPVGDDELPVFWACGVTPQSVIAAARLPFCITHAPGTMLVTDLKNEDFVVSQRTTS